MGKGRTGLFENLISLIGGGADTPRATYLRSRLQNEEFARAAQAAADAGEEFKFLSRAAYEMPPPRATTDQVMEGLGFGRPRTDEQIVRDSVAGELGPFFREAPMEQVDDAFTALGRTDGGEDLIGRLEASAPRAEYSIDLPGNTQPRTQDVAARGFSDFTGPFAANPTSRSPVTPIGLPERIPGGMSADIGPGIPAGPPPRGFPAPFAEPRGLVPQGPRGLVPQERGLVPQRRDLSVPGESLGDAPLRLEGPEQLRLEGPRQPRLEGPDQLRIEGPRRARIEGPGVSAERNAMDDLAAAVDADAARRRVPRDGDFRLDAPQRSNRARNAAMAAAAAGGGVAAFKLGTDLMFPGDSSLGSADMEPEPYRPVPNVMRPPRTTADLAAEQNPPPSVMTQEPEVVDYSAMARDKIRQANEIQRREGRVTPESAGLTREADALYRRSADERSAGRGQPIMPSEQANAQTSAVRAEGQRQIRDNPGSDPRSQARNLLGRINAGEFGDGPQRQAAVNEANRLFAMADNQRYGR
jgi:hypothetical protein